MDRLSNLPRRAFVIGIPVVAVAILVLVLVLRAAMGGGGGGSGETNAEETPTGGSLGLLQEGPVQQQLESGDLAGRQNQEGISNTNPNAPAPGVQGDQLIIPSINVDAALSMRTVTMGEDGKTSMANPSGPNDVVWYDFSALPGFGGRPGVGGNTVLSGHVDYHDYGPAVFWDLGKLKEGEEITIHLSDGSDYKYAVQWNKVMDSTSANWNDVVASTPQESLTLITCAGAFDSSSRSYDQRRIVWAVRVS